MSAEQFRRPGSGPQSGPVPSRLPVTGWQPEIAPIVEAVWTEQSPRDEVLEQQPRGTPVRNGLILGVAGLCVGLVVGAIFIGNSPPAPLAITLETFPTKILGQQRDDVAWRIANSTPVVERLNAQFEEQVASHRFAYGGAGAEFSYGEVYGLTIVNGRPAPEVPISDDSEWSVATVISLNSGNTSCVSTQEPVLVQMMNDLDLPRDPAVVVINVETGTRLDPETGIQMVWTECVLFDDERNLGLRLTGSGEEEDMLDMAARFRDELVTVHAGMIG